MKTTDIIINSSHNKIAQQSLLDLIMDNIPELKDLKLILKSGPKTDPNAKKLYDIWGDEGNRIANGRIRMPKTLSQSDIRLLESSGYVKVFGSDLKITPKGASILNEMILSDDHCTFEANESFASNNRIVKIASSIDKTATWYDRAKNGKAVS